MQLFREKVQLDAEPKVEKDLVLQVADEDGKEWLIKRNFTFDSEEEDAPALDRKIFVIPQYSGFASLPAQILFQDRQKQGLKKKEVFTLTVPGDAINPLRAHVAREGREAIKANPKKFNKLFVPKTYLFPIPDASKTAPLHDRYVVATEKLEVMSTEKTLQTWIELARTEEGSQTLRKILTQICRLNKQMRITDLCIDKIAAMKGEYEGRYAFIDTEPAGGWADISQPKLVAMHQGRFTTWDPAAFTLIGLRTLRDSVVAKLNSMHKQSLVKNAKIEPLTKILDEVIGGEITRIVRQRKSMYRKSGALSLVLVALTSYLLYYGIKRLRHFSRVSV